MLEPDQSPHLFGVPMGVDFPQALLSGLRERLSGCAPDEMARVEIIVNTRRMARRIRDLFDQGPAGLLPKIRLLSDIEDMLKNAEIPPANSGLKRRLELAQLVKILLEKEQNFGARASLYDLADSLAALMDEMQGEGVHAQAIADLDVSDQSGHWERAKSFIHIAQEYIDQSQHTPDTESRQRLIVKMLGEQWLKNPPQHPIILAGSTGSRGTTLMLMQQIARLPQGALILPGFDFDMPAHVWHNLADSMQSEDHPQFRFHKLLQSLDLMPDDVKPWSSEEPAALMRNKLVSLALRPAPVTDAWLSEGPALRDLAQGLAHVTLLQAESPREEALSIAMRLRQAAENGQTAALITPDRMLTRQVTAALDRWEILPDDSAGSPLNQSPPGRFLRHVAGLFSHPLDCEALLTLLKHPLTHSGENRGQHQLNTQRLELRMRRDGLPYPDAQGLMHLAQKISKDLENPEAFLDWCQWVGDTFCARHAPQEAPLSDWVSAHLALAQNICAGSNSNNHAELWHKAAGKKAWNVMQDLTQHASYAPSLFPNDYSDLLGSLLSNEEVRDRDAPHPNIMIWGTLEARVQGADLVILSGLNEGVWPAATAADPWLNRAMRHQAGLLLPERRIGLSAHDFQQAISAPEVWLTRSVRSQDAQTVPSRWLNRIQNLLGGLADLNGPQLLQQMIQRGDLWRAKARELEKPSEQRKATRPSPKPPKQARPKALSVTEIERLIRDPYAIYAKHVLRLRPLNPIQQSPDAPMRGILIHSVMELFIKNVARDSALLTPEHLMQVAQQVLEEQVPWPATRTLWLAKLARVAHWFIQTEIDRQSLGTPIAFEDSAKGIMHMKDLGFTLKGFADRIDQTGPNSVRIYDYKTGKPPSAKEQEHFSKQLLIEAAMMEQGCFAHVGQNMVDAAVFIGLGSSPEEIPAPIFKEPSAQIMDELSQLIRAYLSEDQGFTAQRSIKNEQIRGDYAHLARFGEWDASDTPVPEELK